jgi:DNA-binding IclR family transcriptional regulator
VKNGMSRSSPSVLRIVAVLNFFADHPGQAFTLTDLIKALKLSRATCHGVLAGLVESGYLYRTTDKSYVLGPALLYVGEVAKEHFSPLQVAKPEMRALADEFDAVCSAAFREQHDVVVRERAAAISHLGYTTPRGQRFPLLPQFAAPFFVGSTPVEVNTWITRSNPPCPREHIDLMHKGIDFVRANGFLFSVRRVGAEAEMGSRKWLDEPTSDNAPLVATFEIKPKASYNLGFVVAPVLDARGKVAFVLALQGFQEKYTGAEVQRIGRRVLKACERISSCMVPPSARR